MNWHITTRLITLEQTKSRADIQEYIDAYKYKKTRGISHGQSTFYMSSRQVL